MIDEEIRGALKVEPSPEFLARVRTRIASEPAPSAWRWSWTFAAAGALAAVLLIAIVLSRPAHQPASAPGVAQAVTSPSPAIEKPSEVAQAFRPAIAGLKPRAGSRNAGDTTVRLKPDTTDSPLLFDYSEVRALRGLIAAARNGSIALTPATAAAPPAPMELEPVTEIIIAPITIDPIAPLPGAEGVRP